jgi:hypothetical protein
MHPMFAGLFMRPDEVLEADEQRRVRRLRRSRQLRGASTAISLHTYGTDVSCTGSSVDRHYD